MSYEIKNTFEVDTKEPAVLENFGIPKGSINSPSEKIEFFDISNHEFDLRGKDFIGFNKILSEIDVKINPNGDSVKVGSKSKIELTINFVDIVIEVGRGYLGQELIELEDREENLGVFENVKEGEINLEDVELNLNIKNYLGADLNSNIEDIFVVSKSWIKRKIIT